MVPHLLVLIRLQCVSYLRRCRSQSRVVLRADGPETWHMLMTHTIAAAPARCPSPALPSFSHNVHFDQCAVLNLLKELAL